MCESVHSDTVGPVGRVMAQIMARNPRESADFGNRGTAFASICAGSRGRVK